MRVGVVAAVTVAVLLIGLQTNAQPVPSAQKSGGEKALIYVYRETSNHCAEEPRLGAGPVYR
jgi:hypothetical protein